MSRLLKEGMEPVHGRTITMRNYRQGDSHIICHGRLEDIRDRDNYRYTGEMMKAGILHEVEIILLVKVPEMIIEDIEIMLGRLPRGDCLDVGMSMEPLKGEVINQGFTKRVRRISGGVSGCTHLVHLLCTMASAVFQGYWASLFQREPDTNSTEWIKTAENLCAMLENSCHTWRHDGEAFQKMLKLIEKQS